MTNKNNSKYFKEGHSLNKCLYSKEPIGKRRAILEENIFLYLAKFMWDSEEKAILFLKSRGYSILKIFILLSVFMLFPLASADLYNYLDYNQTFFTNINTANLMPSDYTSNLSLVMNVSYKVLNYTWLNFDLPNAIANLSYNQNFNFTNKNFSVVFTSAFLGDGSTDTIFSQGYDGGKGWKIVQGSNGWVYIYITQTTNSGYNCRFGDVNRSDGLWHDFIFTFDTTNGIKGYYDGLNINTGTCAYNLTINESSEPLRLGTSQDTSEDFKGNISRFLIYNRALNTTEIRSIRELNKRGVNLSGGSAYLVYYNSSGSSIGLGGNKSYVSLTGGNPSLNTFNFTNAGSPYGIYIDDEDNVYASFAGDGFLWRTKNKNLSDWVKVLNFSCGSNGTFWEGKDMTEDKAGNIYVGQYSTGLSSEVCAVVYKSVDHGLNWTISYNSSASALEGRHIHFVQADSYTGYIYISQGDAGRMSLLRSVDNGTTWQTILNEATAPSGIDSHPTAIGFTKERRYFATDKTSGNGVFYTENDLTFTQIFTLPSNMDLPVYWLRVDNKGYVYIGTSEGTASKNVSFWYSIDNGTNFNLMKEFPSTITGTGSPSNFNYLEEFNVIASAGSKIYGWDFFKSTNGLILDWEFNENVGNVTYDSSSLSYNGTGLNLTWQNDGVKNNLLSSDYQILGNYFYLRNPAYSYSSIDLFYTLAVPLNYTIPAGSQVRMFLVDLESKMTILIFGLFFVVAIMLLFMRKFLFSGSLFVVAGFCLLFSAFNPLLSFIIIFGGVIVWFCK